MLYFKWWTRHTFVSGSLNGKWNPGTEGLEMVKEQFSVHYLGHDGNGVQAPCVHPLTESADRGNLILALSEPIVCVMTTLPEHNLCSLSLISTHCHLNSLCLTIPYTNCQSRSRNLFTCRANLKNLQFQCLLPSAEVVIKMFTLLFLLPKGLENHKWTFTANTYWKWQERYKGESREECLRQEFQTPKWISKIFRAHNACLHNFPGLLVNWTVAGNGTGRIFRGASKNLNFRPFYQKNQLFHK